MSSTDSWSQAQARRLRTPRGKAAAALAVLIGVGAASGGRTAGAVVIVVLLAPVLWLVAWWLTGLWTGWIEQVIEGAPPDVAVGRPWRTGSVRQQLREDQNAYFFIDRGGILMRRRRWFIATGTGPIRVDDHEAAATSARQEEEPQYVAACRDRHFWWYSNEFYWTNRPELGPEDVRALLFARQRRQERELEHAHAVMAAASDATPTTRKREPIPREVKLAVWKRDEGACVECGGSFDLQYDHVIPFSMGGANTADNLQLLCGRCNQRKGGRL